MIKINGLGKTNALSEICVLNIPLDTPFTCLFHSSDSQRRLFIKVKAYEGPVQEILYDMRFGLYSWNNPKFVVYDYKPVDIEINILRGE